MCTNSVTDDVTFLCARFECVHLHVLTASPTPVDTGTIVPTIIDFPESKSDNNLDSPQHPSLDIRVVITGIHTLCTFWLNVAMTITQRVQFL